MLERDGLTDRVRTRPLPPEPPEERTMSLRIGSETGSGVNALMSASATAPVVGEGATILAWSDRYPGTVIAVSKSGKTATVREDRAIRTDGGGMTEAQEYRFEANPEGRTWTFRLTTRGWRGGGYGASFGHRSRYYDFSF